MNDNIVNAHINYINMLIEDSRQINAIAVNRGLLRIKQDAVMIREHQTVGFHTGPLLNPDQFIIDWYVANADSTLVIPYSSEDGAKITLEVARRMPEVNPQRNFDHIRSLSVRPADTIEFSSKQDHIKYVILQNASNVFTYGTIKKKSFYNWVAKWFAKDVYVILVN